MGNLGELDEGSIGFHDTKTPVRGIAALIVVRRGEAVRLDIVRLGEGECKLTRPATHDAITQPLGCVVAINDLIGKLAHIWRRARATGICDKGHRERPLKIWVVWPI